MHAQGDTVAMGARGSRQESFLSLNARLIGGMSFDCDAAAANKEADGDVGGAEPPEACLSVERSQSMVVPSFKNTFFRKRTHSVCQWRDFSA